MAVPGPWRLEELPLPTPLHVLIVEDEPAMQARLVHMLRHAWHDACLDLAASLEDARQALRHSRATRVDSGLHADAGRLRLRDDGCGLPPSLTGPDARGATPGLGPRSMRAARLQGMLHLHSDGRGTELQLEFPLPSARSAATEAAQPSLS